ncbi:HNH endonuclease signature motif containing protein [Microbacterium suaedae]|uniref:HNH endonuclease signature motif containing protein n=1 Tax=Microbacterium suaedae TaxID=2067813 RepID=UPI0013A653E4|nr:HNH endonuclease signature motif containing protein [Microbacterium suaedae]
MTHRSPHTDAGDVAAPWELTTGEASAVSELLDALQTALKMRAATDAFIAYAHAELQNIAAAQAARGRVSTEDEDFAYRSMAAEVATATNVSQNAAKKSLASAWDLIDRYPRTRESLRDGLISEAHARAIADVGRRLSTQEARSEYESRVLAHATTETVFHTRRIAKLISDRIEPATLDERCDRAVARRTVWGTDLDDGISELGAILPSEVAHGIHDRLTAMGRAVKRATAAAERKGEGLPSSAESRTASGDAPHDRRSHVDTEPGAVGDDRDAATTATAAAASTSAATATTTTTAAATTTATTTATAASASASDSASASVSVSASDDDDHDDHDDRTLRQLSADLLADIMLTGTPTAHQLHTPGSEALGAIRATVQITISAETLIGSADSDAAPPLLDGDATVHPDRARRLARDAPAWARLFVRPESGDVIATDTYRPTAAQRRLVVSRDGSCRFPGCAVPARSCDIDHVIDHARGGPTSTDNLGCLCRAHHTLEHQTPWKVTRTSAGAYEWTSPAGRPARTEPRSRVRFQHLTPDELFAQTPTAADQTGF